MVNTARTLEQEEQPQQWKEFIHITSIIYRKSKWLY
jgi:hypothetical protein